MRESGGDIPRRGWARTMFALSLVAALVSTAGAATSEEPARAADSLRDTLNWMVDNPYFAIHANMRARAEFADADRLELSEGSTLRTRLGLGTKPFWGFSAFVEMENVVSFCDACYFDVTETATGQTPIADPEATELNQAFGKFENTEWIPFELIGGRQRIILEDARFIGNVGWRQNEQTFDAGYVSSSLGVPGLELGYGYLWKVQRVFGSAGNKLALADFDSNSHTASIAYTFDDGPRVAVFGHFLDLWNKSKVTDVNSSDSYGIRLTGSVPFAQQGEVGYSASYAYQKDADDNPFDYHAHYVWVESTLGWKPVGSVGVGFEMLGSDDGRARFVTPLATAHKFNGFADVFVDNGGPRGLQDLFVTVAPKLPFGLMGKVVYHHFWSDFGGDSLGDEIDGVVSKNLGYGFSVLAKAAYFNGAAAGHAMGRPDIWRATLDITWAL